MPRYKDANWNLTEPVPTWEQAQTACLMDIRDELKAIEASLRVLRCGNFIAIPGKLDAIRRNTTKRKYTRKAE